HGGALGGLTTMVLAAAGWTALRVFRRPSPLKGVFDFASVSAVGLAGGLVAFVTPYGADIPRTWLDIMHAPRLPEIIREHAPTDFRNPTAWPLLGLAVVYLGAPAGPPPRG